MIDPFSPSVLRAAWSRLQTSEAITELRGASSLPVRWVVKYDHCHMTNALIGGVLLGLAASVFLWLNGRITGISGIIGRLFFFPNTERLWRVAFLLGLLLAGIVAHQFGDFEYSPVVSSKGVLAFAGILVGIGTGLCNGCTSGHGICGLARLSKRSLISTIVFMVAAIFIVYIIRHVLQVPL